MVRLLSRLPVDITGKAKPL